MSRYMVPDQFPTLDAGGMRCGLARHWGRGLQVQQVLDGAGRQRWLKGSTRKHVFANTCLQTRVCKHVFAPDHDMVRAVRAGPVRADRRVAWRCFVSWLAVRRCAIWQIPRPDVVGTQRRVRVHGAGYPLRLGGLEPCVI